MKLQYIKYTFICLITLITNGLANVATGYTFSQPASFYSAIAGGTVLGDINCDDEIFLTNTTGSASTQTAAGFPIGFTFTYDGTTYARFGVNTNGYIGLGNLATFTMSSNGYYGDMSSTGDGLLIGACVNDLQGQTGSILQYLTSGSSPNRTLTVQWSGYRLFGASGENMNFQIILHETSNVIELSYGNFVYGTGQSSWETTSMAGMYGTSNSDYFLRTQNSNWTATVSGGSNNASIAYNGSSLPTNGLMFRYTPTSALPVELLDFNITNVANHAELAWWTASETNNDYYTIERSYDALNFKHIGKVKGNGTTSYLVTYSFTDTLPLSIVTYYRLTQTDFDGKSKVLGIKSVDPAVTDRDVFKVYPNPADQLITIETKTPTTKLQVYILNEEGQMVYFKEYNSSTPDHYTLIVSIPPGRSMATYVVTVIMNDAKYSRLITIQ